MGGDDGRTGINDEGIGPKGCSSPWKRSHQDVGGARELERGGEDGWLALAELICAFQRAGLREERCSERCLIYYNAHARTCRGVFNVRILKFCASQPPPTLNRVMVKGVKRRRRGTNSRSSSRRHAVASHCARFKDAVPERSSDV